MVIARNKKANFDYFILDKFECGIELVGTEVKSIREGKVSIKESYVKILKQELFILNMHIKAYDFGNINNKYSETRTRKLLMHRKEINKLKEKINFLWENDKEEIIKYLTEDERKNINVGNLKKKLFELFLINSNELVVDIYNFPINKNKIIYDFDKKIMMKEKEI